MSKASELEAARLAAERLNDRCLVLTGVFEGPVSPVGALNETASQLLAEATYISEQRKSGWKSRSDAHTAAGRILEQWAKDLAAYLERDKPPTRPPLESIKSPDRHADLDPADGPISAQITSGLLAGQCSAEYVPAQSPDSARIARCGKVVGHTTTAGDEPHGPVTPDVARKLRELNEAPKRDAKLDIAFSQLVDHQARSAPQITSGLLAAVVPLEPSPGGVSGRLTVDPAAVAMIKEANTAYFWPDAPAGETLVTITGQIEPDSVRVTREPLTHITAAPQFSEPGAAPPRQTQQRMTFEAVREHGLVRARGADHRSYSQVQAFSECGIRYALSDLDATPAWWNVGGTALHYACEAVNRQCWEYDKEVPGTDRFGPVPTEHMIETLWTNCLNRSVSETITAHPTVGPDQWRAAKKNAEGYDWWRVHGLDMVRRWITRLTWLYDQGWTIATVDGKPAIELDAPMFIDHGALDAFGNPSLIKVENIIDLAMVRDDTFLIIDSKSGANDPTSTYQLGQYGHALARTLLPSLPVGRLVGPILGAYWLARTDELRRAGAPDEATETVDLRELHPWSEIEYLITTMHAAESQGLYLPNKSKSDRFGCGSCGVSGLCPVGPR